MTTTLIRFAALASLAFVAQQPVRDRARPLTGTASLSGTAVVDEPGDPPLARAVVTLSIPGDTLSRRDITTDDAGRFAFADLPAGTFTLSIAKPGYVTTYYGAKRIGSNVGVPIAIAEGQRVGPLPLRVARGGVITGTLTDENGKPLPDVRVNLSRLTIASSGKKTFQSYGGGPNTNTTDDRGVYRLFGLPPGEYVVSARPYLVAGLGATGELIATTPAELQWAERQLAGGAGATPSTDRAPERGRGVTFSTVYHPAAVEAASAAVVTVAPGQEKSGIDIRARFVATARLNGTVTDPAGQPAAGVQLTLIPKSEAGIENIDLARAQTLISVGLMASPASSRTLADGTFSLTGVEPGSYWLTARSGGAGAGTSAGASSAMELERIMLTARLGADGRTTGSTTTGSTALMWALADVDVSGRDIDGLALTLAPAMTIAGRIAFAGVAPPPTAQVTVRLTAAHPTSVTTNVTISPGADGAFTIQNVIPGSYRVDATAPGWSLQSASIGRRDVADVAFDVKPGEPIADAVVTLTNAPASLSGTLFDAASRPSSDLAVVLFSTDPNHWFGGSRRLRQPVRPDSNGRFSFAALPAGDYYLAALTDYEPTDWFNPSFLEQVVPGAIKVTIGAGERKMQDVRIK
jgi:hypothetical protein